LKQKIEAEEQVAEGFCFFCGEVYPHKPTGSKCRAIGQSCSYCRAPNHLEKACQTKKRENNKAQDARYLCEADSSDLSSMSRRLNSKADDCPRATANIGGLQVEFILTIVTTSTRQ